MIQYFSHNQINRAQWDATIAECGNIYAYSWYLDVVHPNWEALVEDDYQAVMPLTSGKKFGVNYLYNPYFVQQLGIFSKQPVTNERTEAFLNAIPKKFRFCEIRMNENNPFNDGFQGVDYHINTLLYLNRSYEEIRANYHQNTKRNLTKAEANNLQIIDTVIPYHVVALFRDNRGALLDKWGDAEYNVMTHLAQTAQNHRSAFILGVTEKGVGELLCAAIFMQANQRITFLFSGLKQEGKDKQAMTYLLDHVIQKYANKPLVFDFEGSDDDNLARFYLGFGGDEVKYPSYTFNKMSALGKGLLKIWKKGK
jgi:hypothetical protein